MAFAKLFNQFCQTLPRCQAPVDLVGPLALLLAEFPFCDSFSLRVTPRDPGTWLGYAWTLPESTAPAAIPSLQIPDPVTRWVTENRESRFVTALQSDPTPWREQLWLPLVSRDFCFGVLCLASRSAGAAAAWDREALAGLCSVLALALENATLAGSKLNSQRLQSESAFLRDSMKAERGLRLLAGESAAMKALRQTIQQVARTDSTVLILGETGTGKELVARAIHQMGSRRDHLLVAVNCSALAAGVLASELFGHEAGAFTGAAKRRIGRFELAHQGTLFLDEIGELPQDMQVMLLRVLQERVLERVGGHEPIPVDVRVVAATHRDLTAALHAGRFRADLYYRLNVFPIQVPPLRERPEDIPDLVRHFLIHFGRRMNREGMHVSSSTLRLLQGYSWPGNVRELENLIERAMIVTLGETLEVNPDWLQPPRIANATTRNPSELAEVERQAILEALKRSRGRIYGSDGAAAALGLRPTTLYGKMRKLGIDHRRNTPHPPDDDYPSS